ncbi:MAG: YhbY family RNA-binding protein [Candidatus Njordarchaeia archaeon]
MRKGHIVKEKIHSKPDILIGKNGATEALINEIKNQLEKKKTIKIKALKNVAETKEEFQRILLEIKVKIKNVEIVDIRGKTAVLQKQKKKVSK